MDAIEPSSPSGPRSFPDRVIGALRLDVSVYEEVEHDPTCLRQAATVVLLGAVAQAVPAASQIGVVALVGTVLGVTIGWFLGTGVVWLIGVKAMGHTSDYQELLRVLGFATAPQILNVIAIVPGLAWVGLPLGLWGLAAYVVGARQALDVSTGRAILVCALAHLAILAVVVGIVLWLAAALGGLDVLGGPLNH